jgi:transcriptional regulator of acetoin/glycerol metabolism
MTYAFSPLARAVLDSFAEGVVVFDHDGQVVYANRQAESAMDALGRSVPRRAEALMPRFARHGARIAPLRVGELKVGEAVYLPVSEVGEHTLAERERQAILQTLEGSGWRLAESARRLGISRTTLWRRLKEYGLQRDGRGRWSKPS